MKMDILAKKGLASDYKTTKEKIELLNKLKRQERIHSEDFRKAMRMNEEDLDMLFMEPNPILVRSGDYFLPGPFLKEYLANLEGELETILEVYFNKTERKLEKDKNKGEVK